MQEKNRFKIFISYYWFYSSIYIDIHISNIIKYIYKSKASHVSIVDNFSIAMNIS